MADFDDIPEESQDYYPDPYRDITNAIDRAYNLRAELDAEVPGMLRDYIGYVKKQAQLAMQELINCRPDDLALIHEQQKIIAAYENVMTWVTSILDSGKESSEIWRQDTDRLNLQTRETDF